LWCYGILWSWDKPGELFDQGAEEKQCRRSEQHRFVAGNMLPDCPPRSFPGRFISGKAPDNCGVPHGSYHGRCSHVLAVSVTSCWAMHAWFTFPCLWLQGVLLLTLSASIPASIHVMATATSNSQEALSSLGLFLTALGLGGIWPCVPTFGADC
jgi:hypothetical protein